MVTGSEDGTAKILHIPTGKLLHTFKSNTGFFCSVSISDNKAVAGSSEGTVAIWSFSTVGNE